jgi:tetratricopeptide (TPR) repeat protein
VDEGSAFLGSWRLYAWVAAAALALYARALSFGFTYLDDNVLVLDNFRRFQSLSSLAEAFRRDVFFSYGAGAYYRPLLTLSLALDSWFGGASPLAYHLTNVLLHALAACLVLRLLLRLGYERGPALFASLLFALHPVLSQAVAWIPGRNDSLAAVFVLSSFLNYLGSGFRAWAAHVAFLFLALLTKESAVALVPLCLLHTALLDSERRWLRRAAAFAPGWAAAAAGWYLLRHAALGPSIPLSAAQALSSIWLNLPALAQILGKILFPFNLSVLPTLRDTTNVYGIAAGVLCLAVLWVSREKRPRFVAFGCGWFAAFLVPSLILHSTTMADFVLEHRAYLPMAGFLIVLLETRARRAPPALAGALLLAFAAIAWRHCLNFRDRMGFWNGAVRASPHLALAHRNRGAMLYLDGDLGKAGAEFEAAIALNPAEPMAHGNLGLVHMNQGRPREAEEEFRKEIAVNPGYDNGYFNLGLLCYRQGRVPEAESLWLKALEVNPEFLDAAVNLAAVYHREGPSRLEAFLERLRRSRSPVYPGVLKALEGK